MNLCGIAARRRDFDDSSEERDMYCIIIIIGISNIFGGRRWVEDLDTRPSSTPSLNPCMLRPHFAEQPRWPLPRTSRWGQFCVFGLIDEDSYIATSFRREYKWKRTESLVAVCCWSLWVVGGTAHTFSFSVWYLQCYTTVHLKELCWHSMKIIFNSNVGHHQSCSSILIFWRWGELLVEVIPRW